MKYSIFLDSGAFSAMTQGAEIDIDEYIKFIKKYNDVIDYYAALDVIGDPVKSYENAVYMKKKGLNPIPVYHLIDRDFYWFEKICNEFPFIGIGGMTGTPIEKKERIYLITKCFNYIVNSNLMNDVKVHGFGCTSVRSMVMFPWFSVDSSTWIQVSRHGGILVPRRLFGGKGLDADAPVISVSDRRPGAPNYYKKLPPKNRGKLIDYLKRIGHQYFNDEMRFKFKNLGVVEGSYKYRDEVCAIYFRELEEELNSGRQSDFFSRQTLI